jgi:hypothetical protein
MRPVMSRLRIQTAGLDVMIFVDVVPGRSTSVAVAA